MDSILIGPDGGTILKFEPTLAEPVSGPARAGQAILYYLKGVGFRLKTFGADGEPLTEANVSVIFETQTIAPVPVPGKAQVYIKDDSGTSQLFYQDTNGMSTQITPMPDLTAWLIAAEAYTDSAVSGEAISRASGDSATLAAAEAYADAAVTPPAYVFATDPDAEIAAGANGMPKIFGKGKSVTTIRTHLPTPSVGNFVYTVKTYNPADGAADVTVATITVTSTSQFDQTILSPAVNIPRNRLIGVSISDPGTTTPATGFTCEID